VPSLPGFGFSDKPNGPGWGIPRIADAWITLMELHSTSPQTIGYALADSRIGQASWI